MVHDYSTDTLYLLIKNMAEPLLTPQQLGEQIAQAQSTQQPEVVQAPTTPWPVAESVAPMSVQTSAPLNADTAPRPQQSDVLNLWGGKIVNKSSAKYKALIEKGMTDTDITKAFQEKNKKPAETQGATVENKPNTPNQPLDYQSVQPERKTEIIDNLNKYYQTNPELFSNRDIFNQSFDYTTRSPEQQQLLDNRFWQNITRKNNLSTLSKTPSADIATQYTTWSISNEQIDDLKVTDPAKYEEVTQIINKQKTVKKYQDQQLGEETWITPSQEILNKVMGVFDNVVNPNIYDEYKKEVNSDEIKWLSSDLSTKEWEIKQIDQQILSTKSELEAQYKDGKISQGRLNAIIQDQTQLLQNKRNTLAIDYQTTADKYNNKMQQIKTNMEIKEKEYGIQVQQQQQAIQKYQFAYGIYADQQKRDDAFKMEDIRYERDIQKMQYQQELAFNQAIRLDQVENGDINNANPYLVDKAINKWVDSLMAQYDWLIDMPRDAVIARVKQGIKEGRSYGTVLNEIMTDVKGKPLYDAWKSNKLGIDTQPVKIAEDRFRLNGKMYSGAQIDEMNNIPNEVKTQANNALVAERAANGGISIYDDLEKALSIKNDTNLWVWVNCGVQCWGYTTAVAKKLWIDVVFGSTPESKDNAIAQIGITTAPVVWGFVSLNTSAPQWHTGYVTEVSPDGKRIKVLNSNYSGTADKPNNVVTENWFNVSSVRSSSIAPWKSAPSWTSGVSSEVINTLLASNKFTKEQATNLKTALSGWGDVSTVLKNQAKEILGATQWAQLTKIENARDSMGNVYDLMKEFYANGWDTGYIKGNMEKTLNSFGKVKDPELVWIATRIQTALQAYRNAISGTAYSEQEWKDIASVFPWINKGKDLNDTIIKSRLQWYNDEIDSYYSNAIGDAYFKYAKKQDTQQSPQYNNGTTTWAWSTVDIFGGSQRSFN